MLGAGVLLDVPLIRQAQDSNFCGVCCLQMLYEFYGQERSLEQLAAELALIPNGVYAQELGLHLCQNGFAATLATRDTTRFPLIYARLAPDELRGRSIARHDAVPVGDKERVFWRGLLRFLDAGGRLALDIPTLDGAIGPALAAGHPVIVCLDAKALYQLHGRADGPVEELLAGQAGHYVVVTGLDDQTVTVADPSATFGGVARYPRERFVYAWYSYQAYALIAEPIADSL